MLPRQAHLISLVLSFLQQSSSLPSFSSCAAAPVSRPLVSVRRCFLSFCPLFLLFVAVVVGGGGERRFRAARVHGYFIASKKAGRLVCCLFSLGAVLKVVEGVQSRERRKESGSPPQILHHRV